MKRRRPGEVLSRHDYEAAMPLIRRMGALLDGEPVLASPWDWVPRGTLAYPGTKLFGRILRLSR